MSGAVLVYGSCNEKTANRFFVVQVLVVVLAYHMVPAHLGLAYCTTYMNIRIYVFGAWDSSSSPSSRQ